MPDSLKDRNRIHLIAVFVIACGFIIGVRDAVFREMWFDEALTIEFMSQPGIASIYHNYIIPNNQIVYTVFLKFWNELYSSGFSLDFYWRLFSVLVAALTVGVMFERWRKRYGTVTLALVLFAFTYSLPFEIYSTAIRGYMLSMLWIVLSLEFARDWVFKANWRFGAGYFIFCLLAVGTIPSNLLALGGIVIFFFPYFGFKKVLKWKFIYLAAAPLVATALFYLPISRRVAEILKLHEGWNSGLAVAGVVYSSFAVAFLPLLIAGAAGAVIYFSRTKRKFLWALLIFLIPLAVVFIRDPAPFPRVFVIMWPVWILLLCAGLRHFLASSRIWKKQLFTIIFLLALSIGWGAACHKYRGLLGRVFHYEQQGLDDFYNPYYMSPKHHPWSLIQKIKKLSGDNGRPVYLSFNAEPCVIILYSRMAGIKTINWIFDHPRRKLSNLPSGAWVICKKNEIDGIKKRFGIKTKLLFQNGVYSVFQAID